MTADVSHFTDILTKLKQGHALIKQKSTGKQFSRRFFLHEREGFVSYRKSHKLLSKPRIYYIKDIDEIRKGFYTQAVFDQLLKSRCIEAADEHRIFSIVHYDRRKEEYLIAPTAYIRDLWIDGLQYLIEQHSQKTQYHLIRDESWILNFFDSADVDRSGSLSKIECRDLLSRSFNVKVPEQILEFMYKKADVDRDGKLNANEFVAFFHLLTQRKDLYNIMKEFIRDDHKQPIQSISMNEQELLSFLQYTKNQNIKHMDDPKEIRSLINEFEPNEELKTKGRLGLDGFRNMLLSKNFDLIEHSLSRQVYQDMTRPLCDYYINTSHNTYLFYSQVSGNSNPEAYVRVLLMGCRAVELDCYDGPDGHPIVTHKHTLVKSCTFESIIHQIEPILFKATPYPVILNIENHCSAEQQKQMARILKAILGDRLVTKQVANKNPNVLPSPEDLKYKVLIRSKKVSEPKDSSNTAHNSKAVLREKNDENLRGKISDAVGSLLDTVDIDPETRELLPKVLQSKNVVQPELAELFVYLQNVHYHDYHYAKANYSAFQSSSLAESKFLELADEQPVGLLRQTTWRLLRLYPGGIRQDSSNPNPVKAWNYGIQMVALNHQRDDEMMSLYYGKFLDNANCGYVLKPSYLLNAEQNEFNPNRLQTNFDRPQTITVTIISGQFLPRSSLGTSDIPDPYVRVSTHGLFCDERVHKTRVIDNNGFDPLWNEAFRFRVEFPQLCLMSFTVMDYDKMSSDDRLAYFCSPVTMIQTGYRHISLRAKNHDQTHATLFVHIQIEHESAAAAADDDDDKIVHIRL